MYLYSILSVINIKPLYLVVYKQELHFILSMKLPAVLV